MLGVHVERRRPDLVDGHLHQPGLADPGRSDDRHHGTAPGVAQLDRVDDRIDLVTATDEVEFVASGRTARPDLRPDRVGLDRVGLAFDVERFERLGDEQGAGAVECIGAAVEVARWSGRHQPRRQIDGVAHHREGGPVLGADLTGEHVAAVDADLDGELRVGVDDAPHGAQHASVVVVLGGGNTGGEDQLAAVLVEVGGEQRDARLVDRRLGDRHDLVERGRHAVGPGRFQQRIDTLELDESDRCDTMLGLGRTCRQVVAEHDWDAGCERLGRHLATIDSATRRSGRHPPLQFEARPLGGADRTRRQQSGGLWADQDLAGVGGGLDRCHLCGSGAGHHEFVM